MTPPSPPSESSTAAGERVALPAPSSVRIRIGGGDLEVGSGGTTRHEYAATGEPTGSLPLAGQAEVDLAVASATRAQAEWTSWTPAERRDGLLRLRELIVANSEELALLAVLDNGTPISVARRHASLAAPAWIAYYAGWADKVGGDVTASFGSAGMFSYAVPQPYGVIAAIVTWNTPLMSICMKVGAALAAGNAVVVKPSEVTPYVPDRFAQLVRQAALPDGLVCVLPGGAEAGDALVRHPGIGKVSFTGGPTAARQILSACAESIKPSVMELGGKSANIILPDADLGRAVDYSTRMPLSTLSGQGCVLPTRLLVHADVYDDVVARVVDIARSLTFGDPLDPETASGPLATRAAQVRVTRIIERARQERSGRCVVGGDAAASPPSRGHYVPPTVFVDVDPGSELAQEEVFGPVLAVTRVADDEEAVTIANSTDYGLGSYVQSADVERVHRLAERLYSGAVYVNGAAPVAPESPYGGVALSGFGREGGRAGLDEYLFMKTVAIGPTGCAN